MPILQSADCCLPKPLQLWTDRCGHCVRSSWCVKNHKVCCFLYRVPNNRVTWRIFIVKFNFNKKTVVVWQGNNFHKHEIDKTHTKFLIYLWNCWWNWIHSVKLDRLVSVSNVAVCFKYRYWLLWINQSKVYEVPDIWCQWNILKFSLNY